MSATEPLRALRECPQWVENGHPLAYPHIEACNMLIDGLLVIALLYQPAPATCPIVIVENFSILRFDSGSAELSQNVRTLLDGWITTVSVRVYPTRFQLIGQADRVGSRETNRRLSYRRADAVRRYLMRRGVAERLISVRAEGEDQVLVETADEVPEPQNRVVQLLALADAREEPPRICQTHGSNTR